jgi:uncharacterized membrane protein YfcA
MLDLNILVFIAFGFVAQMIDGCLGMAYGVSSTTFFLSLGVPPVVASACVHTSEMFTTAASGISHFKFGNVDRRVFIKLLLPGIIGGVLGAYVLTELPGGKIRPFVSIYLLIMGAMILFKVFRKVHKNASKVRLVPLGLAGGFFDAIGGGGWGPIVTTTLVANGNTPRYAIGSVNSAEFFVTIAESITFFVTIGTVLAQHWEKIVGLLIGGVLAAPLAAYLCKKTPTRVLMILVGLLIVGLSVRVIYLSWLK